MSHKNGVPKGRNIFNNKTKNERKRTPQHKQQQNMDRFGKQKVKH